MGLNVSFHGIVGQLFYFIELLLRRNLVMRKVYCRLFRRLHGACLPNVAAENPPCQPVDYVYGAMVLHQTLAPLCVYYAFYRVAFFERNFRDLMGNNAAEFLDIFNSSAVYSA